MIYGTGIKNAKVETKGKLGDYWHKGHTREGVWMGQACREYGVEPGMVVKDEEFRALKGNRNAETGERVTFRTNTTREEWIPDRESGELKLKEVANRREFYDFVVSAPPTFSVLAVTGGKRMAREWHNRAVEKMMREMERLTGRRVNGGDGDRIELTGKFCAARYQHDFNKCLEPQLHDHLVIFNMTPGKDGKNYALETRVWMDRTRYLTAVYRDTLAHEAIKAGFEVEIDRHGAPQLKGLEDLAEVFSQRFRQIELLLERVKEYAGLELSGKEVRKIVFASRGLDVERFKRDWETNRAELDALKDLHSAAAEKDIPRRQLLKAFRALVWVASDRRRVEVNVERLIENHWTMLDEGQRERLTAAVRREHVGPVEREPRPIDECLDYAVEHCFSRASVVKDYEVLTEALVYGMGENVDLVELRKAAAARADLIRGRGCELTTPEHLTREHEMAKWVREGKGKGVAVDDDGVGGKLSDPQKAAVCSLLKAQDQFSALVGRAGVGKSFCTTELVAANLKAGHKVFLMAPSNAARDVLRLEADELSHERWVDGTATAMLKAESLQMFLSSPITMKRVKEHDLLILDEASGASVEDVQRLMAFARGAGARLLFSGDTRQHVSVEAGDALRILLKGSDIRRAALFDIVRQRPGALGGSYLEAARLLSQGKTTKAFALLQDAGAVVECSGNSRAAWMAKEILKERDAGRSVIAVNPTHRENDAINDAVRETLKSKGVVREPRTIASYRSLGWSMAKRSSMRNICVGHILEVTRGADKGRAWEVVEVGKKKVKARDGNGVFREFGKANAGMIDVCERRDLEVGVGDELITRAGVRSESGEVINGERVTVQSFDDAGNIRSKQGKLITTKNLAHAYAMTSYRSQGDTADTVIFGMDRKSIRWASQKLAYVGGTRGRMNIRVVVENIAELTGIQMRPGDRKAATEMEIRRPESLPIKLQTLIKEAAGRPKGWEPNKPEPVMEMT